MQRGVGRKPYRGRLRVDSTFYLELQFCSEHGLAHSEFLTWSADDRAKMLAFTMEKSSRCTMCGTAPWEWDEKAGGSRFAYEAIEHYCPGCYIKGSTAADTMRNPGITVELSPTGTREAAQRRVKARDSHNRKSRSR